MSEDVDIEEVVPELDPKHGAFLMVAAVFGYGALLSGGSFLRGGEDVAAGAEIVMWVLAAVSLLGAGLYVVSLLKAHQEQRREAAATVTSTGVRVLPRPDAGETFLRRLLLAGVLLAALHVATTPVHPELRVHVLAGAFSPEEVDRFTRLSYPALQPPLREGQLPYRQGDVLVVNMPPTRNQAGILHRPDDFTEPPTVAREWALLGWGLRASAPADVGTVVRIRRWRDASFMQVLDVRSEVHLLTVPLDPTATEFKYGVRTWTVVEFIEALPSGPGPGRVAEDSPR